MPKEKSWGQEGVTELYYVMWGHCFVYSGLDNFRSNQRVIPLDGTALFFGRDGHDTTGYSFGTVFAEAGMAFHYDTETKAKYWGAPGAWNWTGTFVV
jgi:hypothetical protein